MIKVKFCGQGQSSGSKSNVWHGVVNSGQRTQLCRVQQKDLLPVHGLLVSVISCFDRSGCPLEVNLALIRNKLYIPPFLLKACYFFLVNWQVVVKQRLKLLKQQILF